MGIGIRRKDYHRPNRRENKGHRFRVGDSNVNTDTIELEQILNLKIDVPSLEKDKLIEKARAHFHKRPHDAEFIAKTSIERMCVDYLKHRLTRYDGLQGKVKGGAYLALVKKVSDAISQVYPWLSDECAAQYARRVNKRVYDRTNVRLVKHSGNLTSSHIEVLNESESRAFSGVDEGYEIPGFLGEVDISEDARDPNMSSLHPDRFIYYPPFLKKTEVAHHRFGDDANDRWWEWEEEKGLAVPQRENRFMHAPWAKGEDSE
jgi:hypothetical protein